MVHAFTQVPRERYLGPGPWKIFKFPAYQTTTDADPKHLYHDVLVAIDPVRFLNNGQPSFLAFLIDALDLQEGEHVVHIGCGTGYYTAILAEIVGSTGRVTAIEIDAELVLPALAITSPACSTSRSYTPMVGSITPSLQTGFLSMLVPPILAPPGSTVSFLVDG